MTGDARPAGGVVEVLGDGMGALHRQFLVALNERQAAINAVLERLGANTTITSSSPVSAEAFDVARLEPGQIVQI